MRLIDADAFLRSQIERCHGVPLIGTCSNDNYDLRYILDGTPTVDAVVLPCTVGETVFCITHSKNEVVEDVVEDYDIWSIKDGIKPRISLLNHKDYVVAEFGKTIFLTREEAEAALAERTASNENRT